MGDKVLGRRQLLVGAGVAAGATAVGTLATASPAMAHEDSGDSLAGSWLVRRQSDTDPTDKSTAVFSLAGGNVIIVHDINPAGPPFTGTWARRDGNRFRATMWTGLAGGGPGQPGPGPTVQVELRGRLQGGVISGTYGLTIFDATTGGVLGTDTGTFTGPRIAA